MAGCSLLKILSIHRSFVAVLRRFSGATELEVVGSWGRLEVGDVLNI